MNSAALAHADQLDAARSHGQQVALRVRRLLLSIARHPDTNVETIARHACVDPAEARYLVTWLRDCGYLRQDVGTPSLTNEGVHELARQWSELGNPW